jgi:hypothetical protein
MTQCFSFLLKEKMKKKKLTTWRIKSLMFDEP